LLAAPQSATGDGATFRHVLFAGAARVDKGFDRVHALLAHFMSTENRPPVLLQASPPHTGALEPQVQKSLHELDALGYPHMRKNTQTLHEDEYFEQFRGGICLQLYDPQAFAVDRVSGVTLDALGCGCPVIATAGTWMAKVVERFDAGVVMADRSAPVVAEAVGRIVDEYEAYHRRALEGGRILRQEHDAGHLLKIIRGQESGVRSQESGVRVRKVERSQSDVRAATAGSPPPACGGGPGWGSSESD
jgi:glycosyltransferase involved in cell wall biosynthesis